MSRMVPWAPANAPSSNLPTAVTSDGNVVPSLRRMTNRSRIMLASGWDRPSHVARASSIDSSATTKPKCWPTSSAGV